MTDFPVQLLYDEIVKSQVNGVVSPTLHDAIDMLVRLHDGEFPPTVLEKAKLFAINHVLKIDVDTIRVKPGCFYMYPSIALNYGVLKGIQESIV